MWAGQKILMAFGFATMLAGALAGPTFACERGLDNQPANLRPGGDLGYYLWHDEDGFHLRTTGPGDRHIFNARLETGGEFQEVQLIRPEGEDSVVVGPEGHLLVVHLETFGHLDGVDFKIANGRRLLLALERDGALSPTEEIYLGADGEHPPANPFFGLCLDRLAATRAAT